jgi:hypothetical protein
MSNSTRLSNPAVLLAALTCIAAAHQHASAHEGPRIWLGQTDGRITTYTSNDDFDPTDYFVETAFIVDFDNYGPGIWATDFPGFESRRSGNNLTSGTLFSFDLAGPLLYLDQASSKLMPASQLMPAPAPRLAVSQSSNGLISGTGFVEGFPHFSYIQQGNHDHLFFTLLGDGSTASDAPDGVWGIPLRFQSNRLADSPWVVVLFNKQAPLTQLVSAYNAARSMTNATPGDTNFDGQVDFIDLLTLARNYNANSGRWWADGDFTFDGQVGFTDLLELARNYSPAASFDADWARAQALVPEPSTLASALSIGLICLRRQTGSSRRFAGNQPHETLVTKLQHHRRGEGPI